jgi:hypothetical protein
MLRYLCNLQGLYLLGPVVTLVALAQSAPESKTNENICYLYKMKLNAIFDVKVIGN